VSKVIERQKILASAFRKHMTEGQTYDTSNSNRRAFYKRVTELADKVNSVFPCFCENDRFPQFVEMSELRDDEKEPRYILKDDGGVPEAGTSLCNFIDEHDLLDSPSGPRRPLVVLAFDEAHTLTDNPPGKADWNLYSELRRILRQINHLPIFSLFLSTAGRFDKFSPDIHSDPSARARELDNRPLDPISEISFDDIARPALKGTITIDRVVEIDWLSHLGRPLYVHRSYPFRAAFLPTREDLGLFGTIWDGKSKQSQRLWISRRTSCWTVRTNWNPKM